MFVCTTKAQQHVADSLIVVLEQYGREDTTRVNLMNDIAYAVYNNRSTMAEEYARKAGKLSDQLGYKRGKAMSLWLLGLSNLGRDKKESLDYFEQALAISEKINDKQGMANYLIAVGNVVRDLGQHEKGDRCFQSALDLATALGDNQIEIKCLTNISRSLTSKGLYPQAIEGLEKASSLAIELGDKLLLSRCYNNIGSIYMMQSHHPMALDYLLKAMRVNEQMQDKAGILGNLLNIAGVKSEQKDYPGALKSAQKAMLIAEEISDTIKLSTCLTSIGNIYLNMNDKQALDYLQKALGLLGDNNIRQSINILTSIGTIHRKNNNYALALNSYNEALKLSEDIGLKRGIAQVWCRMGTVYLQQKDYTKALDYTLKSSALARELGNLELQKDVHSQLANIYGAKNDFKRALEHHKLFKSFNDSIFNTSNVKKLADLESAYKYDKERQFFEVEQQRKDLTLKSQRSIILALSVSFALMLLLALSLYCFYKQKRHTNKILVGQKAQIEELNKEYIAVNEKLSASNKQLIEAKQRAEESEKKVQLILRNSSDGIVLINEQKKPLFISEAVTGITGFGTNEIQKSFVDFIHPEDKEKMSQHWERVLSNDDISDTVQFRYQHQSGDFLWVEAVSQNLLNTPAIGAVLSNIRNIDVQKKAEVAVKEREALQKELLQLEIEKINDELEANKKTMTAASLKMVQNSERDAQTIKTLEEIGQLAGEEAQQSIKSLISIYKIQSYSSNWDEFELLFQKVHHSFHEKLNEQFPELTPNERKLCVFLKLNMNSKQIALITYQSEEALKKARLRLRKKLEIDRDTNLVSFIQSL